MPAGTRMVAAEPGTEEDSDSRLLRGRCAPGSLSDVHTLLTPSMLTLTREAKGWTQRDLARHSDLSQAAVSKVERGLVDVRDERLRHLASILNCPVALLTRPDLQVDNANMCLHHRRRQSRLSAEATRRIEGIAHLTRVTVEGIFDGLHVGLDTDVTPHDLERSHPRGSQESVVAYPAQAAQEVRVRWGVHGPIADLAGLVESHGILVVTRSLGSRGQDGVSSWPADLAQPPIIVMNSGLSPDRARFTIAHELGHLLLHRVPSEGQEGEANLFAAEFLVPETAIKPLLKGLTTADFLRLARLKDQWRVSIGMLVQRANDVGAISERQFREFRIRLSRLGWDVNEPGDLPIETPTLLHRAIDLGIESLGLTVEQLADLALMTPTSFRRHYLNDRDASAPPRRTLNAPEETRT